MSDHMTLTPHPLPFPTCSGLCEAGVNLNLVVFLLDWLPSDGSSSVNVDGKLNVFSSVDGGMMPPPPAPPPLCVCYLHHDCDGAHLCWNCAWTICTEDH